MGGLCLQEIDMLWSKLLQNCLFKVILSPKGMHTEYGGMLYSYLYKSSC